MEEVQDFIVDFSLGSGLMAVAIVTLVIGRKKARQINLDSTCEDLALGRNKFAVRTFRVRADLKAFVPTSGC
jgi:hypothetical protein